MTQAAWNERFGKIENLVVRGTKKGPMATLTLDCTAFKVNVVAFGDEKVDAIKAIGNGGRLWVKGPMEQVQRRNEAGNTYAEDALKAVYMRDPSKPSKKQLAEAAAAEQASAEGAEAGADVGVSEGTAAEMASAETDDEIPF